MCLPPVADGVQIGVCPNVSWARGPKTLGISSDLVRLIAAGGDAGMCISGVPLGDRGRREVAKSVVETFAVWGGR